jgi:hypothetical protein
MIRLSIGSEKKQKPNTLEARTGKHLGIASPRNAGARACGIALAASLALAVSASQGFAGTEPGSNYKLVDRILPDEDRVYFEHPPFGIVQEVYRNKGDGEPAYKIMLSAESDPSHKVLFFSYDRLAETLISPNEKWIVVNDRPGRGDCEPRLFERRHGLKFAEMKDADISSKAILYFLDYNKCSAKVREHMTEGDCIVQALFWSDDSGALLLRIHMGRTGEPIWIWDWYCVYDLRTHKISMDLSLLNKGGIVPPKYLAPK